MCQAMVGPPLGTLGSSFWPLRMLLQDGMMMDLMGSVAKGSSSKGFGG